VNLPVGSNDVEHAVSERIVDIFGGFCGFCVADVLPLRKKHSEEA